MAKYKLNPELYRKLSEPFETEKEMDEAIEKFSEEVANLREQRGLLNVVVVIGSAYLKEGEETQIVAIRNHGDMFQCSQIASQAAMTLENNIVEAMQTARGRRIQH